MSLILASGSPRRRELMALITPNYTVAPSDVDESRITAATPAQRVKRAIAKQAVEVFQIVRFVARKKFAFRVAKK